MKKRLSLVGLTGILIAVIYLDSPYSFLNNKYVKFSSVPLEVVKLNSIEDKEVTATTVENNRSQTTVNKNDETYAQNYTLEMILENKSIVDGYVVETYREYEVYKDDKGKLIKSVPTSHYDYIRYYNKS